MTASAGSDAYAEIISERVERGFQPYILTFTFRPLPGSPSGRADQMRQLVGSAFDFYLPHVIRRPRTPAFHPWLPVWALTLDLPVYKHEKQVLRDVSINDGQHYQGMAVEPPFRRNCETLVEHFDNRPGVAQNPKRTNDVLPKPDNLKSYRHLQRSRLLAGSERQAPAFWRSSLSTDDAFSRAWRSVVLAPSRSLR